MTGHNLKVLYYKMIGKLPQPSSTHIAPAWFLEMQFVGKEGLEDLGFEYVGTPQMVVIF